MTGNASAVSVSLRRGPRNDFTKVSSDLEIPHLLVIFIRARGRDLDGRSLGIQTGQKAAGVGGVVSGRDTVSIGQLRCVAQQVDGRDHDTEVILLWRLASQGRRQHELRQGGLCKRSAHLIIIAGLGETDLRNVAADTIGCETVRFLVIIDEPSVPSWPPWPRTWL